MDRALHSAAQQGRGPGVRAETEFVRARRHSRLVVALKIGLPLIAVLIVVAGLAVTWLARSLPGNVSVGSATIENGQIVMQDPRMSGYDKNDRPYSMVARRATQSLTGGGVELEHVEAKVTIGANDTAQILSAKGHYDLTAQVLRLYDNLTVETTDGMSIKMSEAEINLGAGSMTGGGPIAIATTNQTIEAGDLTVRNGGKSLTFGKGVRMSIVPSTTKTD